MTTGPATLRPPLDEERECNSMQFNSRSCGIG
jgi:hypothetical protein